MTRASKSRVSRVVHGSSGREYVAEVHGNALILRPLRSRKGGPAQVSILWGQLYVRLLWLRGPLVRRRPVRRGLLA